MITTATETLGANAKLVYGNKVAPTFTFGWGNAIPRSGRHFAFPVEIGAAYTGTPQFTLNVAGNGCASSPCSASQQLSGHQLARFHDQLEQSNQQDQERSQTCSLLSHSQLRRHLPLLVQLQPRVPRGWFLIPPAYLPCFPLLGVFGNIRMLQPRLSEGNAFSCSNEF